MLDTERYTRKTFPVEAIRVTAENMELVAKWCMGTVETAKDPKTGEDRAFIKVRTLKPMDDRQTQAFEGDWVLNSGMGYKIYQDYAFNKNFEKAAATD